MEISTETITPQMAERYLKKNVRNRSLSKGHVRRLASYIREGKWQTNGDTIRFSETGRLLDGQHRLTACVMAGIPITTLVVRGVPDQVFDTIDLAGKARSNADILSTEGIIHCTVKASAANMYHLWLTKQNPTHETPEDQAKIGEVRNITIKVIEKKLANNEDVKTLKIIENEKDLFVLNDAVRS